MSHNTNLLKQTFNLNGAGNSTINPILSGLPFDLVVNFNKNNSDFVALIGATDPPTTSILFTQITNTKFKKSLIAGVDTAIGKNHLRFLFNGKTVWQKFFFIAALPSNAVQIFNIQTKTFNNININTLPTVIPTCSQMCGIRFFPAFIDEFSIHRYGGAFYVSIFDQGTDEDDTEHQFVRRITKQRIDEVKFIYLEKHLTQVIENHEFIVRFRAKKDDVSFVDVNCKVFSVACWGFELKDPITE